MPKKKSKVIKSIDDQYVHIKFDKKYLVPLSSINRPQQIESPQEIYVIANERGDIICKKDGYRTKLFYDYYFSYLVDTGYIKLVKEN